VAYEAPAPHFSASERGRPRLSACLIAPHEPSQHRHHRPRRPR
jgi:hypothetical protein